MDIEIFGKGRYAASESQQFVDRDGNLVRAVKGSPRPIPVGEAYAFYDCRKPAEQIEGVVNTIRRQMPEELELYLLGSDSLKDSGLRKFASDAGSEGMTRMIRAYYPNATNSQTAEELERVLNQIYQSPLYEEGEQFRGRVVHKHEGTYRSIDARLNIE